MQQQSLVILGSTGSIGEQALDIVREHAEQYELLGLTCNSNWETLARQINEFRPRYALLCNEKYRNELEGAVSHDDTELLFGADHLEEMAALEEMDIVLNSLVGFVGFAPTMQALKAGKKVALANKESLVVGGSIIDDLLNGNSDQLIPVDSEHSAMLQCLVGEPRDKIEKLLITASGGPFRTWSKQQMENITVEDALDHPNWSMGAKITIDSATMMNKGLEIIEAHWLFDLPLSKIDAVVHPQSVIHSIITFVDGSSKAQLGPPNMKVPILYALTYPERLPLEVPRMNWEEAFELSFEPVDYDRFPCIRLALAALEQGGAAPAILNAANEVAVQRFLDKEIPYIKIPKIIETTLETLDSDIELTVTSLTEIDNDTRNLASKI
ncbi:1-deoxy-D-xylulose-5-phosphate reductoisomerase [Aliifodinibius sp. S!AR15-10]|uniref:1-deoxy-D-xylulose-5-phosphate reductoisomerase n=1 Tax=Aliifodinibius sp. S!AR15-10 TaxID=2950437 RepID=UPI00285A8583|nr:1-deoxy-D-xylulose-5-phosphate reductoisomerase [Aliifodinibius sp. S!AR15-10]MDR8392345.1 1-deoxy-D-xylulose-5-phosphate reductoisomerase [Aliifodinibius sp. S!AR15-10]